MKRARQIPLWPTAKLAAEEVMNGRAVLAARVKGLRGERHLSQATLAERAGMHHSYVSSIERGPWGWKCATSSPPRPRRAKGGRAGASGR